MTNNQTTRKISISDELSSTNTVDKLLEKAANEENLEKMFNLIIQAAQVNQKNPMNTNNENDNTPLR